jgi:hypothetical protein
MRRWVEKMMGGRNGGSRREGGDGERTRGKVLRWTGGKEEDRKGKSQR